VKTPSHFIIGTNQVDENDQMEDELSFPEVNPLKIRPLNCSEQVKLKMLNLLGFVSTDNEGVKKGSNGAEGFPKANPANSMKFF
jgi:hypothetical protein